MRLHSGVETVVADPGVHKSELSVFSRKPYSIHFRIAYVLAVFHAGPEPEYRYILRSGLEHLDHLPFIVRVIISIGLPGEPEHGYPELNQIVPIYIEHEDPAFGHGQHGVVLLREDIVHVPPERLLDIDEAHIPEVNHIREAGRFTDFLQIVRMYDDTVLDPGYIGREIDGELLLRVIYHDP